MNLSIPMDYQEHVETEMKGKGVHYYYNCKMTYFVCMNLLPLYTFILLFLFVVVVVLFVVLYAVSTYSYCCC